MQIKNTQVKVVKGDITEIKADAIVNPANNQLLMGGGVALAIKKKGGKIIEDEAKKLSPIKTGDAVATSSGSLMTKYVIHAATMDLSFETDEKKIRDACANSLMLASKLGLKSIALPALGCGVGRFPLQAAARIMSQEALSCIRKGTPLEDIVFVLYKDRDYEIFKKTSLGYLEYVQNKIQEGPFVTVDIIIETKEGLVLIKRENPPFGWALPGGFVDYGESLENAAQREAMEETGLNLESLIQFHTYSEPDRDPRFHTVSTVFIAKAKGKPCASSDAKAVKVVGINEIENINFAFDHKKIIEDYIKRKKIQP